MESTGCETALYEAEGRFQKDGKTESELQASSLNNWGVDNEFQNEHAEFEVPSRHPGRHCQ